MTDAPTLLPCPWDGKPGALHVYHANDQTRTPAARVPCADIRCDHCGASRGYIGEPGETPEHAEAQAIAAWNRRATTEVHVTDAPALLPCLREIRDLAYRLRPHGHSGDEESGQCDEDCAHCIYDQMFAALRHALDLAESSARPSEPDSTMRRMFELNQCMRADRDRAIGALLCAAWAGCLSFDRARELLGMSPVQLRAEATRIFAEEKV